MFFCYHIETKKSQLKFIGNLKEFTNETLTHETSAQNFIIRLDRADIVKMGIIPVERAKIPYFKELSLC